MIRESFFVIVLPLFEAFVFGYSLFLRRKHDDVLERLWVLYKSVDGLNKSKGFQMNIQGLVDLRKYYHDKRGADNSIEEMCYPRHWNVENSVTAQKYKETQKWP